MNLRAVLALFGRSVRDDTRSKALLWARIGIAAAVLFAILRARLSFSGGAPGLRFFSTVVWMNFIFICVAGISYFASSITEEKEEGTLGLLRMTELSPVAILLGKSTSRFVGGLLLLLVQLPFVMLAITLGGVRLDQVIGCYALLAAFLFFACNVGLLASVVCARAGTASLLTAAIVAAYLAWPLALENLPPGWKAHVQELILTFTTPALLDDILHNFSAQTFLMPGALALLAGGLVTFLVGWALFERFAGKEPSWEKWSNRDPRARGWQSALQARPGRAWDNAICWRDYFYFHGGTRLTWLKSLTYFIGALWLGVSMLNGSNSLTDYHLNAYFGALFTCSLIVVIFDSLFATSRIFRLERKDRTLSSLMILPAHSDALIKAKFRAVFLSLFPGLFFLGLSALLLIVPFFRETPGGFGIWFVQGAAYLLAQVFFNHWLVAWFSLRVKWGGLALALTISWLGNTIAVFLAALLFQTGFLIVLIPVTALASFAMYAAFRERLRTAASED